MTARLPGSLKRLRLLDLERDEDILAFREGLANWGRRVLTAGVVVFPIAQIAARLDWPSKYFWDTYGSWALVFSIAVVTAGATYRIHILEQRNRRLTDERISATAEFQQERRERVLEQAVVPFLLALSEQTSLPAEELSCSIWRLPRQGEPDELQRVLHTPAPAGGSSGISFTKGKGVVGQSWEDGGSSFVADMSHLQTCSPEVFDQLDERERFRLSRKEFHNTRQYSAIWVIALFSAHRTLEGFICADSRTPGAYAALSKASDKPSHAVDSTINTVHQLFQRLDGGE